MEFKTLSAMLATQASDGQVVTVRDSRQSYIYLKNRPDLEIDNVNVFETPVSSDRWVAEKAIPTWDESAIVSALGYTPEDAAQKGEPNGYPELDADGKVPLANMPSSVFTYKGTWNASTNTPALEDGTGVSGDTYRVSVAGTQDLGAGNISFQVDDRICYNGTTWEKWDANDAVTSVNGRTGAVTAQAGDYAAHYAEKIYYAKLSDVKASNTAGGSATTGSFITRTLNTEDSDSGNIVSLASNKFTLGAGTYRILASAPGYRVSRHKAILYNVTDSANVLIGTSEQTQATEDQQTRSIICGEFTIASSKDFEIRQRFEVGQGTNGLGLENGFGVSEVYTVVELWKVA